MTQFTSFVAVEEMTVTEGGVPRRVEVPVEMPEGMNRETTFGEDEDAGGGSPQFLPNQPPTVTLSVVNKPTPSATPVPATRTVSGGVLNGASSAGGGGSKPKVGFAKGRGRNMGGGDPHVGGGGIGGGRGNNGANYNRIYKPQVSTDKKTEAPEPKLSPAEEKRARLETKLSASLVAVVDRLKDKNAKPSADEARFVRDGRAEIQIWLTEKSEETLAQLKRLGFEVVLDPQTAKLVIGRLPIEKLEALAELTFVRYVAPQMSEGRRQ